MSRLVSLLTKSTKSNVTKLFSNLKILFTNSTSVRMASSKSDVTNHSANESDKPQWERSDRYKIFYGYNEKDEADDKGTAHLFTFLGIFGFIMMPGFLLFFYPDYKTNDWCHREAYLELARREKAGEPLVSPDYVPCEQINLPSEEELDDTEIVI